MALTTYDEALTLLAKQEGGEGWLVYCEKHGIYQLPTAEWVDAIAGTILPLGAQRPLEVGAGSGELGRALSQRGIPFAITDPAISSLAGNIEQLGARDALAKHCPDLVLSCWLPFDSDVEKTILTTSSVRWYLAIVQTGPGFSGGETLWQNPAWHAAPIVEAGRWSVSRSDFLSGVTDGMHVHHGVAILFSRQPPQNHN